MIVLIIAAIVELAIFVHLFVFDARRIKEMHDTLDVISEFKNGTLSEKTKDDLRRIEKEQIRIGRLKVNE